MNEFILLLIINISSTIVQVFSTIDINLAEYKYLAIHLDPYECRRLVAALHYTSYDLPKDIGGAVRKVSEDIPCLQHLLHWNNSPAEGRGKTHADLVLRLRQINRKDLADWLGKTVFKELGKDVLKSIDKPFGELGQIENETQYPITDELTKEPEDDNIWNAVDTFLTILLGFLSACLMVLMVIVIIHRCKWHFYENKKQSKTVKICGQDTCVRRKAMSEEEEEEEEEEDDDDVEEEDDVEKFLSYSKADTTTSINTSETDDQKDD